MPLVDAIEAHDADKAAELMKEHILDLLSGLDLTRAEARPERLADILVPPTAAN